MPITPPLNLLADFYHFFSQREGPPAQECQLHACPPVQRCNTDATGWLNGGHPTVADGQVSRQVCFHYGNNCCHWARNIYARNCSSSYYVYYLSGTPTCSLRYCSTDYKQDTSKVLPVLSFRLSRLHCTEERKKRKKRKNRT